MTVESQQQEPAELGMFRMMLDQIPTEELGDFVDGVTEFLKRYRDERRSRG